MTIKAQTETKHDQERRLQLLQKRVERLEESAGIGSGELIAELELGIKPKR